MKLAVLWSVVACVAAIDLSCEEYCTCLSSGHRNVEYQPECDCMYAETDFEDSFKESGIYYEPAAYVPLPAYIYNHPFYIINPILQLRGKNFSTPQQTIKIQHQHTKHISDSSQFNTKIEIDIDNTYSSHKRKEKDVQADDQRSNSPIYLDIHFEGGERSASLNTFTAEELKQTEQSLIVCAELYALLNYRINENITNSNGMEPSQFNKYDHLTNSDLMKAIDNKCVHIYKILQKSLNEIKANQPTKLSSSGGIINQLQENNELLRETDILNSQHSTDMITEANVQQTVYLTEGDSTVDHDYKDKDTTDVIHTESESQENETKTYSTLPSQVATSTVTSTSNEGLTTLGYTDSQNDAEEVLMRDVETSTEKQPFFTSISIDNEYPLHTDDNLQHTESTNNHLHESSTSPDTINVEQENRRHNGEKDYQENRSRYNGDVPLAKVITHEFSNNTVQSYINGTEDVPNDDFKNDNFEDDNGPIMSNAESIVSVARSSIPIESDIHGHLYFLVNQHQIPAKFIQKPNGTLHIGIDAVTICDKFKKDGKFVSKLFSTLCKCYESDNCTSVQN